MTKSSQWFLSELQFFFLQAYGEESRVQTWLSSSLCKHGMALITDVYFGVTSEAAGLLFVSALCFPGWAPASPRESTCKEYYSVPKRLSPRGTTPLSVLDWLQVDVFFTPVLTANATPLLTESFMAAIHSNKRESAENWPRFIFCSI